MGMSVKAGIIVEDGCVFVVLIFVVYTLHTTLADHPDTQSTVQCVSA